MGKHIKLKMEKKKNNVGNFVKISKVELNNKKVHNYKKIIP